MSYLRNHGGRRGLPLVIFRDRLPGPLGLVLAMLGSLVPSALGIGSVAPLRGRSGVRTLLRTPTPCSDRVGAGTWRR